MLEAPLYTPPPMVAELLTNVQLTKVGLLKLLYIPPPITAELFVKAQLITVGLLDAALYMPPPNSLNPFWIIRFSKIVLLVSPL